MTALFAYCISFFTRRFHLAGTAFTRYPSALQPFVKHATLSFEQLKGRNLLIIGDVHGCYDEAMELIEKVERKYGKNLIKIFVGDMVNKGPKNVDMLNFIMKTKDVHCIRGNHEQAVLRTALQSRTGEGKIDPRWSNSWATSLSDEQFNFLTNLPYTISIPTLGIVVVHGGLNPRLPLDLQDDYDMLHMRGLKWVKDDFHGQILQPTSRHEGYMWATCYQGPNHIYFGHDAIKKLQMEEHCTGLDTGCLYGGKLTGVFVKVPNNLAAPVRHFDLFREFFYVDAKEAYVPVG